MNKIIRSITIVLFTFYPILFVYFRNESFVFEQGVSLPLLIIVVAAFIIYILLNFIQSKPTNNALIVILILFWFMLYGHIYYSFLDFFHIHYSSFRHRFFVPIYTLLFFIPIGILLRSKPVSDKLITVFFIIGFVLNIQFIVPAIHSFTDKKPSYNKRMVIPTNADLPDVYYIIPDSYPNAANLKKYYNFDNSNFINELKALNFQVLDSARSNYPYTYFSVPSSLNMEYINYFEDSISAEKRNEDLPFLKVHHNKVADYFQSKGYQYVLFQSAYKEFNNGEYANTYITNGSSMNYLYESLIELSVISCLNIRFHDQEIFNITANAFQQLPKTPEIKGNKFVFFHCLPPHPPHVFDENGAFVSSIPRVENRYSQKKEYIDQVKFVNTRLLGFVKDLLKNSKKPPIIIIQGDHGTCTSEKSETKWQPVPSNELLRERYGILNAIYIPQQYGIDFQKDHTPVNTFRYIINELFKDTLTILPNRSYISKYRKPYNFKEINWKEVN